MVTEFPLWNSEQALQLLHQYWKYSSFRGIQESVIRDAILQRHQIVLMPTGAGKSICYQLPALYAKGLVLVVSPLISLMEDQVERLQTMGICAAALHSGCSESDIQAALNLCVEGQMRVLYLSPERIQQPVFKMQLPYLKPLLCVIDEAHCISQWGFDFRTSYLDVCELRDVFPKVPVMALTATAGHDVVNDIQQVLHLGNAQIKSQPFIRPLLKYHLRHVMPSPEFVKRWLDFAGNPGILYFRSRKKCESWNQKLLQLGLKSACYHAGLTVAERKHIQQNWMQNAITVLCATTAFGMGVDKADVRLVIHIDLPESPEAYYQESGRAGRDNKEAHAVLCYQPHLRNQYKQNFNLKYPQTSQLHTLLKHLYNYAQISYGSGLLKRIEISWETFCTQFKLNYVDVQYGISHFIRFGYIALEEGWNKGSQVKLHVHFNAVEHETLSTQYKTILQALWRLYPEIESHGVRIQESQIAAFSKMQVEQVKLFLNHLHKLEFLSYFPRQDKLFLTFLKPRADADIWDWPNTIYENRKAQQLHRLNNMLLYVQQQNTCLQQYLVQLFSNSVQEPCGNCMNCLRNAHIQKVKSEVQNQFYIQPVQTYNQLSLFLGVELELYLSEHLQQLLDLEYITILHNEGPIENHTFVRQRLWH